MVVTSVSKVVDVFGASRSTMSKIMTISRTTRKTASFGVKRAFCVVVSGWCHGWRNFKVDKLMGLYGGCFSKQSSRSFWFITLNNDQDYEYIQEDLKKMNLKNSSRNWNAFRVTNTNSIEFWSKNMKSSAEKVTIDLNSVLTNPVSIATWLLSKFCPVWISKMIISSELFSYQLYKHFIPKSRWYYFDLSFKNAPHLCNRTSASFRNFHYNFRTHISLVVQLQTFTSFHFTSLVGDAIPQRHLVYFHILVTFSQIRTKATQRNSITKVALRHISRGYKNFVRCFHIFVHHL